MLIFESRLFEGDLKLKSQRLEEHVELSVSGAKAIQRGLESESLCGDEELAKPVASGD